MWALTRLPSTACYCLLALQVFARKGDEVLRDQVEWDLNDPSSTASEYASCICTGKQEQG